MICDLQCINFTEVNTPFTPVRFGESLLIDIDQDSDLDVFVSGAKQNPDGSLMPITETWINSNMNFQSFNTYVSPFQSTETAWGDFNNDSELDFLISGTIDGFFSGVETDIVMGWGSGAFITIPPWISYSGAINWIDYEHNGKLDFIVFGEDASNQCHTDLYQNRFYGYDIEALNLPLLKIPVSKSCDLNGDGIEEILVSGIDSETNIPKTFIIICDITGVQTIEIPISLLYGSIEEADINLNGNSEVFISGIDDTGIPRSYLLSFNSPDLSYFTLYPVSFPGVWLSSAKWGDFDNDGDSDLIICGMQEDGSRITKLYINTGSQYSVSFAESGIEFPGLSNGYISLGDVNEDGKIDILMSGYNGTYNEIHLYINDTACSNTQPTAFPSIQVTEDNQYFYFRPKGGFDTEAGLPLTQSMLNIGRDDGCQDIKSSLLDYSGFSICPDKMALRSVYKIKKSTDIPDTVFCAYQFIDNGFRSSLVYRNKVALDFNAIPTCFNALKSCSSASFDADNDNDLDYIVSGQDENGIARTTLYLKNDVDFSISEQTFVGLYSGSVSVADFNKDGRLDILLTGYDNNNIERTLVYQNSPSGFSLYPTSLPGVGYGFAKWIDTDYDGTMEVLISGDNSGDRICEIYKYIETDYVSVFINTDGFKYTGCDLLEYNRNGFKDLIIWGQTQNQAITTRVYEIRDNQLYLMQQDMIGVQAGQCLPFNLNNDYYSDIIVTGYTGSSYTTKLYLGSATGFITSNQSFPGLAGSKALVTDIDHDGDDDIIISGVDESWNRSVYLLVNSDGQLEVVTPVGLGMYSGDISLLDLNNDNVLDIITSGETNSLDLINQGFYIKNTITNSRPEAPLNLRCTVLNNYILFDWDVPLDDHTMPDCLSYRFVLKDPEGNCIIDSGINSEGILVSLENTNNLNRNFCILNKSLFHNHNGYQWAVVSIDSSYRESVLSSWYNIELSDAVTVDHLFVAKEEDHLLLSWEIVTIPGHSVNYKIWASEDSNMQGKQLIGTTTETEFIVLPSVEAYNEFYQVSAEIE